MFSNRLVALVLVLASCLGGCARFGFGEKLLPAEPLKVSGGESACLNGAGKVIEDYISASAGPDSLEKMFGCVDNSIQLFLDRTRTSTPGIYQPLELRNFIEKFFIGENRISNALMAETMEFKRTILGGRGDILTADELRSARRLMKAMKDQLLRLEKYRPLTISKLAALPASDQDQVLQALGEAATVVGQEISANAGDYSMTRLEALLREFERIFPGEGLRQFISRFKLIRMFKPVLFGTSADEFRGEEWPRFLRTAARAFGIYIKVQPIYPDESGKFPIMTCGTGLLRVREAGLEFLQMMDESVRYHGSLQMIPMIEFSRVIDALDPSDFEGIRRLSMKRFMRPLIQRYLSGDTEGVLGRDAEGLTLVSIDRARRSLLDWVDGQSYIEGVFNQLGSFDCQGDSASRPTYLKRDIQAISVEAAMRVNRLEDLDPRTILAIQKLRKVIQQRRPMYGQSGNKLWIDSSGPRERFTYNDLFQANWLSIGFSLVQQGYREKRYDLVRERARDPEGMAIEEVEQFYLDLREIGADLKFVDPNNYEAARLRFRDGNLFMPSSDGDMQLLSLSESIELMGAMTSGKVLSLGLHESLEKVCKSIPGGMFDTRLIDLRCYRQQLVARTEEFLSHLPTLVAYLSRLKEADRTYFFDQLFGVAMANSKTPEFMEINNADVLATLLHYIELVYSTFDRDYSSTLNTSESLMAFDRFQLILLQLAKGKVDDQEGLRALFTYMLTRGKAPETGMEKLGFLWWKNQGPKKWKMSVDRSMIVQIFGQISASSAPKSTLRPVSK